MKQVITGRIPCAFRTKRATERERNGIVKTKKRERERERERKKQRNRKKTGKKTRTKTEKKYAMGERA